MIMNQKTSDMLNRITSSFCVLLTMIVVVNIIMMFGSVTIAMFGAWAGVHLGMTYFSNIDWWKAK